MSLILPASSLDYDRSMTSSFIRAADSGREVTCIFCRNCGTRIVHEPAYDVPIVNVRAGTLDDPGGVVPVAHTWLKSKQAWVEIPSHALVYDTQPTTEEFVADLAQRGTPLEVPATRRSPG